MGSLKSIQRAAHDFLPDAGKKMMYHLDFTLANFPGVYRSKKYHPSSGLKRGAVTFSLDFEMAWAWQFDACPEGDWVSKGLWEREQVPHIIAKFEELNIPATWATVGHLFLHHCVRASNGMAHAEMPRLQHFENENWKFTSGDWYQFDPCSDVNKDPAWYAPDLIEKILASPVKHEIACHSFSHGSFGRYCSEEVAAGDVDACIEAMRPYGLRQTTWVFPRHEEGNFSVLSGKGFRIVRSFPKPRAKISLPLLREDGMWGVHVSSAIDRGKGWSIEQRLGRLKKCVDEAADRRMSAHFWLHPSLSAVDMREVLFPLLRYCAQRRDEGLIDLLTIEELVDATEDALRMS